MLHPAAHPSLAQVPLYPAAPPRSPIHLASNESAHGPSPRALRAAMAALSARYPDPDALGLRRALASAEGLCADQVIATSGATEAIQLLVRAFTGEVLTSEGSFPLYARAALAAGRSLRLAARGEDGRVDLDALAAAIGPQTRLIFLSNPDNPTGTTAAGLREWLGRLPSWVVPVIDEAYAGYDPLPDLQGAHENLVRLRSFSKFHGLASLRIGAALARTSIIDALERVRDPFNLSAPAQAAALEALADEAWQAQVREGNAAARRALAVGLRARGLRVVEGAANFVFLPEAPGLAAALEACAITVRPLDAWGFRGAVRVTVGRADEQARLFSALRSIPTGSSFTTLQRAS